ncbi:LysR family transcriptional regulator [Paraburkholderia madseniana]|uniref:LysR family transcriptional regulator n=1 Tax=Paraburkholderia madseniana TaxID=2599607 RepID=A0A6N6W231_9BURK|nr:LysR family transcriptional regulator [Paraburkholderia madseniana]KAE8754426.1 LysR family transcriptional regulator [Paraburkholderia madseniana]
MTLQQLHYFLAAIEHGTLSKAAEQLNVAQPTLSDQIIRLEESVGTTLFIRTNRKLMLTEAGRGLQPFALAATTASRQGYEAVQSVRDLKGGVASFGTFGTAHHYFLADLIEEFRSRHPDMKLKITGNNSSEVADAVSHGELEAGLVMIPLTQRNLAVSEPVWSARVGYISADPARLQGPKTIEDLAAAPLILTEAKWSSSDSIRSTLNARAQKAGVILNPIIEVDHQSTGFELAARGLGDVIASRPILHRLGYEKKLGWTPIDPPLFEVFAFIHRYDAPLSAATRVLLQLMREHLARVQRAYGHLDSEHQAEPPPD